MWGVKMIKEINESEFDVFLKLMAEVEHVKLDMKIPNHKEWLRNKIKLLYLRGTKFLGFYNEGNEPIGFITILHEKPPEGIEVLGMRAEVLEIGVFPNFRRQGYGSILLKAGEEYARSLGVYCMFMMTYAEDYDVIAFYGKNGFIPVATLPDTYGPNLEGNLFMRKILK